MFRDKHSNFVCSRFKIRDTACRRLMSARGGGSFPKIYVCNMIDTRYKPCRFDCDQSIINSRQLAELRLDCPVGVCPHLSKTVKSGIYFVAKYVLACSLDILSRGRLKYPQRFKEFMSPSFM
jgi:hypothetical protein